MSEEIKFLREHLIEICNFKELQQELTYDVSLDILKRVCFALSYLQQENQQLKEINSFSKRELYKINKDRLYANLKLVEENKKLKEQLGNRIVEFGYKETKYKSVLDEIREYIETTEVSDDKGGILLLKECMYFDEILQILDKVKE